MFPGKNFLGGFIVTASVLVVQWSPSPVISGVLPWVAVLFTGCTVYWPLTPALFSGPMKATAQIKWPAASTGPPAPAQNGTEIQLKHLMAEKQIRR